MPKRKKWPVDGAAAELLVLLETVTADGVITEEEAHNLSDWLQANGDNLGLPGLEFLRLTVTQVLADGKVTDAEKTAVYKAVEKVLPPEARRIAKERRTAVENIKRERVRAETDAAKEQRRRERERDRSLGSDNFIVAGVSYKGRSYTVRQHASVGDPVFLARDPENEHDPNAIRILLRQGYEIGFVPRVNAAPLASLLDRGCKHTASITKILEGRVALIPIVDCTLYGPSAEVLGAVRQSEVPARREALASGCGSGCALGARSVGPDRSLHTVVDLKVRPTDKEA